MVCPGVTRAGAASPRASVAGTGVTCIDGEVSACGGAASPATPDVVRVIGSGWGGVWTARDDFLARRRRTKWCRPSGGDTTPSPHSPPPPPRLYVDARTIIREVTDVCELQKGDHCMIAINLLRCLSPMLDYWVSFLGSIELIYFYHHFIMVDDVTCVDEQGIPRTGNGELAELVEYANTLPEALEEVRVASLGRWQRWPFAVVQVLLDKSRCQRAALADYGDTKHLYKVVETMTLEDRERIVQNAVKAVEENRRYHFLFNNCEHFSNRITRNHFVSPNMHFGVWSICRTLLCCMGLFCLHVVGGACYSKLCVSKPLGALIAYHTFATAPVVAQALYSFAMGVYSVWLRHAEALISRDDFYHLQGKEFGRLLVVGGGTAAAISLMPTLAHAPRDCLITGCLCVIAYLACDLMYNFLAHAVMRLVLLPIWGRVWLIGAEDAQRAKKVS